MGETFFESVKETVEKHTAMSAATVVVASGIAAMWGVRFRDIRAMESLMARTGVAKTGSLDGLELLDLTRPKHLTMTETALDTAVKAPMMTPAQASSDILKFPTKSRVAELGNAKPLDQGAQSVVSFETVQALRLAKTGQAAPSAINEDLMKGLTLRIGEVRVSLDSVGLTTVRNRGADEVLFRKAGSDDFENLKPLMRNRSEVALPAGELKINFDGGQKTSVVTLADRVMAEPVLLPKILVTSPLSIPKGKAMITDGALRWTDQRTVPRGTWADIVNTGDTIEATMVRAKGSKANERFFWNGAELALNRPMRLDGPGTLVYEGNKGRKLVLMRDRLDQVFKIEKHESIRLSTKFTER